MDHVICQKYITVCYKDRYASYSVMMIAKENKGQVILQIEPLFS